MNPPDVRVNLKALLTHHQKMLP